MRRITAGLGSLAIAAGLTTTLALSAGAAPPDGSKSVGKKSVTADELPNRAEEKRRALREVALQRVLQGKAKVIERNGSKVVKVSEGRSPHNGAKASQETVDQYVELQREKSDKIFVVLAEFADQRHPSYPDQDTDPDTPGPTTFNGPVHNAIPAPDRSKDNSTVWQPDYTAQHYRDMYFGEGTNVNSLKEYYERQSSGRYTVDGTVTDWVKVPFNEARYGRSDGFPCSSNVCSNTWALIKDAIDTWVNDQKAKGRTDDAIKADLASYDQWDRNDYDEDGNFNEPDGYIDHFQIVHAGGDQADGDPHQGEDAIWSHRWKAFQNTGEGPSFNKDGGTQIGNTGLWVADYTIQPENGGLSVFAHEYGHDLGLPDHYDTAGGPDNAVSWWTLMAQSRVSAAGDEGIGTKPADLGAWDKLQLGWLDYEVVPASQNRTLELGPHEYNSAKAQGVVVPLGKTRRVVTSYGAPAAGSKQWWSGQGDDIDNTMTRSVTLPAGAPAQLAFQAKWNIEDCDADPCDYGYVEVNDGTGFKAIPGNITKAAEGNGIDGLQTTYTPATFDLSSFAGKTVQLRLRYFTDGGVQGAEANAGIEPGLYADQIAITSGSTTVFSDGAESGANGWTLDGFSAVGATSDEFFDHYYVASNRTYNSWDQYLKTGPYNFSDPSRSDWVEHFPYQNGLLVNYWDTSYSDNNESEHPGEGEVLPIDANPRPIFKLDGKPWRGRIQTYDSPFSLEKSDSFTLHDTVTGQASYIRGQAAVPAFDDRNDYWYPETPTSGVKVPRAGVKIQVLKQNGTAMRVRVSSTKTAKPAKVRAATARAKAANRVAKQFR
jgi:immune inhibitor A